ncbi:hypothetical protein ABEV34_06885 [Methylorubrum rhodesianum]|uniref:hypothetical protein n=1 Tax=Methylorubrum TaxID=2282523 RepID=UPI00160D9033|nr:MULTISPECIES: hypothetical protein [Methylorubrum]MBB5765681.1 hypothetical protein [Methylorubrum rhodesianum]MBI1691547.1 hypothetical protein [Methylorubrum sp. DB1722]
MIVPPIAFQSGLTAWQHVAAGPRHRIELGSSSACWTPDRDEAATFLTADAAWDHVFADCLPPVRVRS